jgi:hypothetical protein
LTQQEADALADRANDLKKAVNAFRNQWFETLTPGLRDGLRNLSIVLGDEANDLTVVATRLTLVQLHEALANLRSITDGVNEAADRLSEVSKVMTIATSLVDLGTAIVSADPGAVLSAALSTLTSLKG